MKNGVDESPRAMIYKTADISSGTLRMTFKGPEFLVVDFLTQPIGKEDTRIHLWEPLAFWM